MSRAIGVTATLLAAVLVAPATRTPSPRGALHGARGHAPDDADAPLFRLIDSLRHAAAGLEADGRTRDWAVFPALHDPPGDAAGDPGRDLVRVSLAPTAEAVWVAIRTAGSPSRDERAFWLDVDAWGSWPPDLRIGLSPSGRHVVRLFGADGARSFTTDAVEVALGQAVEVRIPLAWLEGLRPPRPKGGTVLDPAPLTPTPGWRSWVRIWPLTWHHQSRAFHDLGPAVASFRLLPTPYPLDPPLPRGTTDARAISLPVEGRWLVGQGPFSRGRSHADLWAYDLGIADGRLAWAPPGRECRAEAFYSWDRPVRSPSPGRVARVHTGSPDDDPCGDVNSAPNGVFLEVGAGAWLWLAHLRRGSVTVRPGAYVGPGRVLGRVGNSGGQTGPHLHLGLYGEPDAVTTLPLAFRGVRVALNPGPDDPWTRNLSLWEPREGFFVERREP